MEQDDVRIAKTEALFRDVNERIAQTAERFGSSEAGFVCECGDPSCADRLELPLEEYEQVREDATHFLLADGHEVMRIERVVKRRRGYAVVEKFNATVASWVRRLDPRTQSV